MRGLFFVGLALCALPASAQVVYKCAAKNGMVTYQDDACPEAATTLKAWAVPRNRPARMADPRPGPRRREQPSDQRQPGRSILSSLGAVLMEATPDARADSSIPGRATCEEARKRRKEALENAGHRQTYDLLRQEGEAVKKACAAR